MEELINFKNVKKTYNVGEKKFNALDGVNFSINKGEFVVILGPSGAGKSSIINEILPNAILKTGEISKKIERGKHTTRQVELLEAWENTYIVDSPGFTSLSLDFISSNQITECFKEFRQYFGDCKFCDCKHLYEPNCAIKHKVGINISSERYERYTKFLNEILERERKFYD